jgi:hypothetical protein
MNTTGPWARLQLDNDGTARRGAPQAGSLHKGSVSSSLGSPHVGDQAVFWQSVFVACSCDPGSRSSADASLCLRVRVRHVGGWVWGFFSVGLCFCTQTLGVHTPGVLQQGKGPPSRRRQGCAHSGTASRPWGGRIAGGARLPQARPGRWEGHQEDCDLDSGPELWEGGSRGFSLPGRRQEGRGQRGREQTGQALPRVVVRPSSSGGEARVASR